MPERLSHVSIRQAYFLLLIAQMLSCDGEGCLEDTRYKGSYNLCCLLSNVNVTISNNGIVIPLHLILLPNNVRSLCNAYLRRQPLRHNESNLSKLSSKSKPVGC